MSPLYKLCNEAVYEIEHIIVRRFWHEFYD
jgi:hypothetical protein